jgi:hypothetical protein
MVAVVVAALGRPGSLWVVRKHCGHCRRCHTGCESAGTGNYRHYARAAAVVSIRGRSQPHSQLSVITMAVMKEEGDTQARKVDIVAAVLGYP